MDSFDKLINMLDEELNEPSEELIGIDPLESIMVMAAETNDDIAKRYRENVPKDKQIEYPSIEEMLEALEEEDLKNPSSSSLDEDISI